MYLKQTTTTNSNIKHTVIMEETRVQVLKCMTFIVNHHELELGLGKISEIQFKDNDYDSENVTTPPIP